MRSAAAARHSGRSVTSDLRITVATGLDPESLASDWRALEARAVASFFQSWTWVGCRARERFPDPVVLRAERAGSLVGLALLNRTTGRWPGPRLWLGESGAVRLDAVYVEHNGPLLADGAADLLSDCLTRLLASPVCDGRPVRLSGVDAAHLAAARRAGAVRLRRLHPAPCIDLTALGEGRGAYLASLSANTRYQIRRSDRFYAESGTVMARRAETLPEALEFLDGLAALHQAAWTARGKPGAFADPDFIAFHRILLHRALPRGEADLIRVSAGPLIVGYLYNFRYRGCVYAYQSGFDYAAAGRHGKPGLTCHHAAIVAARQDGITRYDFLAGEDRYKTSLANDSATLHWLDLAPRRSAAGLAIRMANLLGF